MSNEGDEDSGRPSAWRIALLGGGGLLVVGLMATGVFLLLSGDKEPPRKVSELTIVAIVPPPPPPPPPPEQKVEEKVVEQTPVKQEIIEEKAVDIPKDAPPDLGPDPTPGPPNLDLPTGPSGNLAQGSGRGGGGGGGGSRWGWYGSMVETQIQAALLANEKTRHAVIQVQIRLWSDSTGRINRVQLVSSTGNTELDAVIRDQVLGGMMLREPPPKDMPMPITMRVTARAPG
jgi:hypothetical protein